jgi:hypothetical protein
MYKLLSFLAILLIFESCGQKQNKNEADKAMPFNTEAVKKTFTEYKNLIDKAKEEKKLKQKLREDIGLKSFDNKEIDISECELWFDGQNIVRIDVRYYDGAPTGTKHWYIKDSKPIGVSVAQFTQKEDDTIGEKLLYELVYDESGKKWLNTDSKSDKEKDLYSAENNAEWELLKNLAEKYKPKAENEKDKN